MKEQKKKREIIHVTTDIDERELEAFDDVLVALDNGVTIALTLKPKLDDPLFAEIKKLSFPKTDGERIYWSNGASLTVSEIMAMLREDDSGEDNGGSL